MRRWMILTALILLGMISSTGAATSAYNEGNRLYRQGDYAGAIRQYQGAISSGLEHADLYYNLGNAHFKAGEIGLAALSYERARRLSPSDPDILENIAFVDATKVDRFDVDSPNAVTRFLIGIYQAFSPDLLMVFLSLSFAGLCFAVGAWFFSGRRTVWFLVGGLCLVACLAWGGLLTAKSDELSTREGIVLIDKVQGRSGPGGEYLQVFTLHEATKVSVERAEGRWTLVRLPNGIGGGIPTEVLGMI